MADSKTPVAKPVMSVEAAAKAAVVKPKPTTFIMHCVKTYQSPQPAKVAGHDCMREEYCATLQFLREPNESHPRAEILVKSLEPLPFVEGVGYKVVLEKE